MSFDGRYPQFWRGEEKFTATPWRLFYGAGEKRIMRVGVNIFLISWVCSYIMGCGCAHQVGGDFRFQISVKKNVGHFRVGCPSFMYKFLKQVWYFARLIVLWRSAEGTCVDFVFLLLTRHSMQASSALVSFVGSEILKQVWYFARLIVPLTP